VGRDPGGQFITDPAGSGNSLLIFVAIERSMLSNTEVSGSKSFSIIKNCVFFFR
jgi:hypothetical protein